MTFLSAFILPGLVLIAIPILLHLLNRRQVKVVNWAAMRFLHDIVAQRRRQIRPEDLLLMILRMVLLAVLVLALAQPMIKSVSFVGAQARQDVVLIIDATTSTSLVEGKERLFDREIHTAVRLLEELKTGDAVSILLANQTPVWLTPRPTVITSASVSELKNILAQAKPLPGGTDFLRALDTAALRLTEGRHPHRQILVLTDGQATGWNVSDIRRWQFLRKTLDEGKPVPVVGILPVSTPPKNIVNLSIMEAKLDRRAVGVHRSAKAVVVIRNTGTLASGARTVHFSVDGQEEAAQPLSNLEPGEQTTLESSVTFPKAGSALLTVTCPGDDAVTLDKRYDLAVEVLDRLPVLVVDGAPSGRVQDCQSYYVAAALNPGRKPETSGAAPATAPSAPEKGLGLVADVKVVTVPQLAQCEPNDFAAVLLLNVPLLPPEVIGKLRAYVERGGGVLFAPGGQTDPAWVNAKLLDTAGGILPARILERANKTPPEAGTTGVQPQTIQTSQAEHLAVALAMDPGKSDVDQAKVFEHWKLAEPAQQDEKRRVILRLTDKSPLVELGTVGKGRVLELAVPLDMNWTNWPARRFYPVLLNEMVSYLAEPQVYQRHLPAGMPLIASSPASSVPAGTVATLTDPLGRVNDVTGESDGSRTIFRAGSGGLAGVYRLRIGQVSKPSGDGRDARPAVGGAAAKPVKQAGITVLFTVAPDPAENDLSWLTGAEREKLVSEGGLTFFDGPDQAAASLMINQPGTELAGWLLAMVLGLLVAEILFTRWLSLRRDVMPMPTGVNA